MLSKQISTRLTRLSHLNPLSIFITVKLQLVMDLHPFLQQAVAGQALLSSSFFPFLFPLLFFRLPLKAAQSLPSGLEPPTLVSAGESGVCRIAMPGSDTSQSHCSSTPAHPSQSQQSSNVAAGYLADHAKLMLVLLKPGDYGGFSLCLFV